MTIGENIKKLSKEKGITMYQVAKKEKISNSYLSEIVNNKRKNPSIKIIVKIAKALNVSVEELIKAS